MPSPSPRKALERAIELLGGLSAFATAIGESPQTVTHWRRRGVPPQKCIAIERVTRDAGDRVLVEDLRPDIEWQVLRSLRKTAAV